jgi:hypothetical protein
MARVTIYVPDEMKAQLEAASAAGFDLNLSRIAVQAYESTLAGLRAKGGPIAGAVVAARVQATATGASYVTGINNAMCGGAEWARLTATAAMLRGGYEFKEGGRDGVTWLPAQVFADMNGVPAASVDETRAARFWQSHIKAVDDFSPIVIRSFVESAMEVWGAAETWIMGEDGKPVKGYARRPNKT